ncbi:MAG: hypothetical protein CUN55_08845, partial [Phototrophicales bacterium]
MKTFESSKYYIRQLALLSTRPDRSIQKKFLQGWLRTALFVVGVGIILSLVLDGITPFLWVLVVVLFSTIAAYTFIKKDSYEIAAWATLLTITGAILAI